MHNREAAVALNGAYGAEPVMNESINRGNRHCDAHHRSKQKLSGADVRSTPAGAFLAQCAQAYGVLAVYVLLLSLVEVHPEANKRET